MGKLQHSTIIHEYILRIALNFYVILFFQVGMKFGRNNRSNEYDEKKLPKDTKLAKGLFT